MSQIRSILCSKSSSGSHRLGKRRRNPHNQLRAQQGLGLLPFTHPLQLHWSRRCSWNTPSLRPPPGLCMCYSAVWKALPADNGPAHSLIPLRSLLKCPLIREALPDTRVTCSSLILPTVSLFNAFHFCLSFAVSYLSLVCEGGDIVHRDLAVSPVPRTAPDVVTGSGSAGSGSEGRHCWGASTGWLRRTWNQTILDSNPSSATYQHAAPGMFPNFSEPRFPHLLNEIEQHPPWGVAVKNK